MNRSFTKEELELAKSVDLTAVASSLGYTVKRIGKYHTLKEMDSIRIYDRSHWYRWSRQNETGSNGGSQIDFLRVFAGMDVKSAVFWLLDFAGYQRSEAGVNRQVLVDKTTETKVPKVFTLPAPAMNNDKVYEYLMNQRALSKKVIDYFVSQGLLYESREHHNAVFKGNDKDGITRFASMRGTYDRAGKSFKCDVAGNDKRYGFHIANEDNKQLFVFEAAIDLMSYVDLYEAYHANMLALGMVSDAPLETFLKEHPQITEIIFCLDHDEAGRKATDELSKKYSEKGYLVKVHAFPEKYKDMNDYLKHIKCPKKVATKAAFFL